MRGILAWIKRHKALSGVIALVVIVIGAASGGGGGDKSTASNSSPTKATSSPTQPVSTPSKPASVKPTALTSPNATTTGCVQIDEPLRSRLVAAVLTENPNGDLKYLGEGMYQGGPSTFLAALRYDVPGIGKETFVFYKNGNNEHGSVSSADDTTETFSGIEHRELIESVKDRIDDAKKCVR